MNFFFFCTAIISEEYTSENDGLAVEFYIAFWSLISKYLVDCINYVYEFGEVSNTPKEAIITLIEKNRKDKRLIRNWRPISLINVDAKIISNVLAKRLKRLSIHNSCKPECFCKR